MNEELEKIAQDMRRKERELWAGNPPRMGNGAVALMLDGYASRLEVALGLAPRPKCEAAAKRERIQRDKVSFRCGDCARFGGDCDAGDSDGNEDRVACEKFVRRAPVPGDAAVMREACRMLNDEGDDTLCKKLKCPWYGEPNGCNSPSGEYPTTAKSSGFGNAVAMHSCLVKILAEMLDLGGMKVGRVARFSPDAVADEISAALAVPQRNCDRFQTASEVSAYWNSNVRTVPLPHDAYGMHIDGETYPTFLDWLFAPAEGGAQ